MRRLVVLSLFLFTACGVKAPPRPPKAPAAPVQPAPSSKPPDAP